MSALTTRCDERIRGRRGVAQRIRRLRDHPLCANCYEAGRIVPTDEIDHVVPLSRGGTDDDTNVQGLCVDCHKAKSAKEQPGRRVGQVIGDDGWPIDGTDRPKGQGLTDAGRQTRTHSPAQRALLYQQG